MRKLLFVCLLMATPAAAQSPADAPIETLGFDEAVARALDSNPSIAIAATNILRAEALLQQARAAAMPRVGASFANTTLDNQRGFNGLVTQPQNQSLVSASASMPVLAAAQWAARTQAMDQVQIARLSTADARRQIAVATADAYLAIISQKRLVDVSQRALETAQAQFDYNHKRVEGGVGSRLNELRAAQVVSSTQTQLENQRLGVRRGQEAFGVLLGANGSIDTADEPAFEVPVVGAETDWFSLRTDLQLFNAQQHAAQRVVRDSSKDWWPTGDVAFDPQYITPAGLFQPSRTWRLTLLFTQPIYDGGQRRGLKRLREADYEATALAATQAEIQARSEVRTSRAAIESNERALVSARQAAGQAGEVLKITILAFDAGASTNIEVIDAQRSARDLETAVAQAEDLVRQARLDLLVALGRFPK